MARHRKIPVRKHHGVRDPLKQNEDRLKKLANVTNNPPKKGDEEQVSSKFALFKKLADAAHSGRKINRRHGLEDKPRQLPGSAKPSANSRLRLIKQFDDEADEDYLRRVNRITNESLREAQYEAKYGVKVIRNAKTGEITLQKQPKNEIDELLKQKRNNQLEQKRHGKSSKPKQAPVDLEEIKDYIKRTEEADRAESKHIVQEYKKDEVKFGEVVHAPPTLSTLPRKAERKDTVSRPGQRNMLLKSLLDSSIESQHGKVTKAQLSGKRKNLPMSTRALLDNECAKLVNLYRELKKNAHHDQA